MGGLALHALRQGKNYRVTNYGEVTCFFIEKFEGRDFKCKDLKSLEYFYLSEITKYGEGPDYEILELEEEDN